jgi:hypothetical protein
MTRYNLSPAEITHVQARSGIRARLLVWIVAKDRATGLPEPVGFWNGDDDQAFTVSGVSRTYHGAGGLLGMDDLVIEGGLKVRRIGVWLATAAQEVIDATNGYDVRLAPIEIHRVLTDPLSHLPIADPHRIWKGWVDGTPRVTPAKGLASGRITLNVVSAAMALTKGLTAKYSDAAMRLRGGDDRIARHADVSGVVPVYWGEQRHRAADAAPGTPGTRLVGRLIGRERT